MVILNILLFIVVLGVIILIHEAGHFYFAKRAGILCHEFSIGMGPALWQKRKGETIYSVRGIPIGGYVSMAGESVSDALIKKEDRIGLKFNEKNQVTEIILADDKTPDVIGTVEAFDLYGKDFDPLYIDLKVDDEIIRYQVLRDATYVLPKSRTMWITPQEKSFESKTLWQRFLVIFAGPFMNFVLAFLLFLIAGFFVGAPQTDSSEIGTVVDGYAASMAGIEVGDVITNIDGTEINNWTDLSNYMSSLDVAHLSYIQFTNAMDQNLGATYVELSVAIQMAGITNTYYDETNDQIVLYQDPIIGQAYGRASSDGLLEAGDEIEMIRLGNTTYTINTWDDIIQAFRTNPTGDVEISYVRDGNQHVTNYELISANVLEKLGSEPILFQLGISPTTEFDLGYSLLFAPRRIVSDMGEVFTTIGLLLSPNENLGIGDLSGPVGIYSLVSNTASQGFISILVFTGFLSINIGLLNLLPIPALDGGRLVFLGIEAVTKKPLPRKIENTINNVMFILLLAMFVFVTYNDIIRLIRG